MPVNYRLTAKELTQILSHARPSLLIVGAAFADRARELEPLLPELEKRWVIGNASLPGNGDRVVMGGASWAPSIDNLAGSIDEVMIFEKRVGRKIRTDDGQEVLIMGSDDDWNL